MCDFFFFFFSSRRRHTRFDCDWSSDVCSSDLTDRPNASSIVCSLTMGREASRPRTAARICGAMASSGKAERSEERREGKSVDLGGRRIIKKKKKKKKKGNHD